ncbi:Phosphoribosylaminoimidazole-succinocarboxamide synthase [Vigna angularis]|uniref:phosphoribosylaminoimidazolesuccinocarboxamide synthase n=1 Tax=Phaseolus angularis TaxID=3914 RepID=A0A8T0JYA0_PHAAN|nr:Phosphoribosylaminoimidazole-succinocarboxamide synthase [Vigna angularis]
MGDFTVALNPPKTFGPEILPPISRTSAAARGRVTKISFKPHGFRAIRASVMPSEGQQHSSLGDSLVNSPHRNDVVDVIRRSAISNCLSETNLHNTVPGLLSKTRGKVRDIYDAGDYLVLVTTDRQSAFDRILASIPFKGQVLNETSLWWFERTKQIVPNAVVSAPDKNVTIAKKCSVFPVEFVARGFVTGSTDTSLWTVYNKGARNYCGNVLPDGMVKNQKLSENILTPTTKAADHDVPVTPEEQVASEHGLILVDTKYEFGKANDGSIMLIDEVHTPDSSRYWIASSYLERFQNGLEPENIDKEFLRLWFKSHCNPYEDEVLPDAPEDLVCELSWRYIFLYETITNSKFEMPLTEEPIHDRISRNVASALSSLK